MTTLRKLSDFGTVACKPSEDVGDRAVLCLLPLDRLVIDDRYQRPISTTKGRRHVKGIVETFDWRKFVPVIVTSVGNGYYAIIDGQHRATAAMLHPAIDMVPCMVIDVTPAEAARCFSAINGNVTSLSKVQIFRARLAGGEKDALEIDAVCRAGGVTILTGKATNTEKYKPGQTFALGAIERCLKAHGRDTVITALKAITESAEGNAGNLRAPAIYALCSVLADHPRWRDSGAALIDAMDEFDLDDAIDAACARTNKSSGTGTQRLTAMLESYLASCLDRPRLVAAAE